MSRGAGKPFRLFTILISKLLCVLSLGWRSVMSETTQILYGHCDCGDVEYELREVPLFCHACHCLDCQRKSGFAFSITCIVIAKDIVVTKGSIYSEEISPRSTAFSCESCKAIIYITSTAFPLTVLLQTNRVNDPGLLDLCAHIWLKRKHSWLTLPSDVAQFEKGYQRDQTWPDSSLTRLKSYTEGVA